LSRSTLTLTVLPDGLVDVVLVYGTRGRRFAQRITVAPWATVLAAIAPEADTRVIVSTGACRYCGNARPDGYGVTCGRSECQEAAYHAAARRSTRRGGAR